MSYETIQLIREAPLATVRLYRPERMNAVTEQMYAEIQRALDELGDDPSIRCLLLTGSVLQRRGVAKPAFCAGADLKQHAAGERSPAQREHYIRLAHETILKIHRFPKPIIAAVNGPARGAGTELALSCDLLLMAEEATLGLPEAGLGTFVGGGITQILPRLVGLQRARELVYTGRVIDGRTAVRMGLALACHPLARLLEEARTLGGEIASKAPLSIAFAKEHLQRSPAFDIETVLEREAQAILTCMESEDWQEGLRAFNDKRKPRFLGR